MSAASALSRNSCELLQGAAKRSAATATTATAAVVRASRFRLNDTRDRRLPAPTAAACRCSARRRPELILQIFDRITHRRSSCRSWTRSAARPRLTRLRQRSPSPSSAAIWRTHAPLPGGLDRFALQGANASSNWIAGRRAASRISIAPSSSRIGCMASERRASSWIRPLRRASYSLSRAIANSHPCGGSGPGSKRGTEASAAANVSAARSNASSVRAPGAERRRVPTRSAARRRRRTAPGWSAPRAEARHRSGAPRVPSVTYMTIRRHS